MPKFIFKIILFILFFLNTSFAEIVNNVQISGNKRISKDTILVLGGINVGSDYTEISLNESLKNLYETDFFKNINYDLSDGLLTIVVEENLVIEKLNINGIKKKSFVEQLYSTLSLKDRMSFTEFKFKKDITLINNILKSNGYYFSTIDITTETNEQLNSIVINLDINLGKKAKIKDIVFIGDKKFKDKKLLEIIASEEYKFWKFITNKVYLNQSLINLDKRLLENYYKNNGYYEVKILNSYAELDNDGFFKIIFNIDSGEKFYFNNFTLKLPVDYDKKDFVDVEKIFEKLKNEEYSIDNLNLILEAVDEIASLRLYDFIKVDVNEKVIDNNKINFTFLVEDSEKFYVEKVNILGNFNTIEEVVRNKLIVDEGDPYNELLHNKSINEIKSLGIFKKVDSEISNGSSPNTKILNISVEEQPTGELSLGAGYGTDGAVFGGGLTEKNFLGKGVTLKSDFQISSDGIKGSIIYSKPNFNYTDNTLSTALKSTSEDKLSTAGYKITTVGASLGTVFEQYENFFFHPEIDFTQEDLTTNSSASSGLKKQEGSYSDFYFNYGLFYDTRDSSFNPKKGNFVSFTQDLPIISNDNEVKNTLILTKYKSLKRSDDMIGKISFYLSAINSYDGSDVRISKRNRVPSNRLRGFEKGKIGPIDGTDFVGGNYA